MTLTTLICSLWRPPWSHHYHYDRRWVCTKDGLPLLARMLLNSSRQRWRRLIAVVVFFFFSVTFSVVEAFCNQLHHLICLLSVARRQPPFAPPLQWLIFDRRSFIHRFMRSELLLSKISRRYIYSSILYRISKLHGFLVVFCYVGAVAADDSLCLASFSFCRSAVFTVIYVCPQRLRSWPAKLTLSHTHTHPLAVGWLTTR